jgi:hypothetical protein
MTFGSENLSLKLMTMACACTAFQSASMVILMPQGESDGPLPTLVMSTEPIPDDNAAYDASLVDARLYLAVVNEVKATHCEDPQSDLAPFGSMLARIHDERGQLIFRCDITVENAGKLVRTLRHTYRAQGQSFDRLKEWSSRLKRGH